MHYVRHDYLPKMCDGCAKAAECLGGCREAARVFSGSPTAPDPVFLSCLSRSGWNVSGVLTKC